MEQHASDDNTNTPPPPLDLTLLEADRGILKESLMATTKEEDRHTGYGNSDTSQQPSPEQLFATGSANNMPMSPTGSASTTAAKVYESIVTPERLSDERPPRHPQNHATLPGAMIDHAATSPTELRSKLSKLEADVQFALQGLSVKDNLIESQRKEIVSQKEEAEEVKQLLYNVGSENETLKQRIKLLEAQQNRYDP